MVAQTGAENPEALNKSYLDEQIQNETFKKLNGHDNFEHVLPNSPTKVGLKTCPPKRLAKCLRREAKETFKGSPKDRYHIEAREPPCSAPAGKLSVVNEAAKTSDAANKAAKASAPNEAGKNAAAKNAGKRSAESEAATNSVAKNAGKK